MIKSLLLLLFIIGISSILKAQNMDSLSLRELDSLMMKAYNEGIYDLGIEYSEKKIALLEKNPVIDSQKVVNISFLGTLLSYNGEHKKAELKFQQALKMEEKLWGKNHASRALTLDFYAGLLTDMGKYEEAELIYKESIEVYKNTVGENHESYAIALGNLASLYMNLDEHNEEKVEKIYQLALKTLKRVFGEENTNYCSLLNNLGAYYYYVDLEKAEKYMLEAIRIEAKILGTDHPEYAFALFNLSYVYGKKGETEKEEKFRLEAVKVWKAAAGENHPDYMEGLNALAELYLGRKRFDLGLAYVMMSLAANARDFETKFEGLFDQAIYDVEYFKNNLNGDDYLKLKELDIRNAESLMNSLDQLMGILREQYNKESTNANGLAFYNTTKVAMKWNETIRNGFAGDQNKLRFLELNQSFVANSLGIAYGLKDFKYDEEAFSFAEQNKSILLADAVKGNRALVLGDLPEALVKQELELQDAKDELEYLKLNAESSEELSELIAEENSLNLEIEAFIKSIKNKYPKYHHLKYENITATATEIQALLKEGEALIEYFESTEVLYAFYLDQKQVKLYQLKIPKATIAAQTKKLRAGLSDYKLIGSKPKVAYQKYTEAAYWFYHELLEPMIGEKQNIKRLIIVADAHLGDIPFEAFLTDSVAANTAYEEMPYLLQDYSISYNYSATLLQEVLNAKAHQNNGQLLAIASHYSKDDNNNISRLPEEMQRWRKHLRPLPEAKAEVETLERLIESGTYWTLSEANEANFKAQAKDYAILHFAMHGLLNKESPILSALAFSENGDSLEDNFLQAYEISKLELNADLVVLSACETGYGKFQQGEGVLSMARSFMYAGVPALIVSLWQVNDASTSVVMSAFYKQLSEGASKDEALRQAKLFYLKHTNGLAAHPAFWSPFIQLGDRRPVRLAQPTNYIYWGLGGLGALFFLLMGLKFRPKAH